MDAVEQPDEVPAVGAVDRRVVPASECRVWCRHRQRRIDAADVQDRLRFEVEHRGVLAEIRDLEHASRAAVVDRERLVAFAAEGRRTTVETEQLHGDRGRLAC